MPDTATDTATDTTKSRTIALLAPADHLPAEGEELDVPAVEATSQDLLRFYTSIMGEDGGLQFAVSAEGIESVSATASDPEKAPVLQYLEVQHGNGDAPGPHIDLASACSTLSLPATDELALDEDASGEEQVRAFLGALNTSLTAAARGFAGTPVPLVRWQPSPDGHGGRVQCLGIWLAEDMESVREVAETRSGEFGAIFEELEIGGRGLREAAAALAIVGFFISSAPTAEAGLFFKRDKSESSKVAEKSGGGLFKKARKTRSKRSAKPREVKADIDRKVLAKASEGNTHVLVDVSRQRAYFLVNGQVAIDTPVSTARPGKHTPRGEFKITQKVRTGKTSTIYGCDLPCWMRLDQSAIGLHVGDLPGYPASAGCVRLPWNVAPLIFDHAPSGTVVKIVDSVDVATVAQL